MRNGNRTILGIAVILLCTLLAVYAFGTTFRVNAETDRSVIIKATDSATSSSGSSSGSTGSGSTSSLPDTPVNPPTSSSGYKYPPTPPDPPVSSCLELCSACHSSGVPKPKVPTTSTKIVDNHLTVYWPRLQYTVPLAQKVPMVEPSAYVVREMSGLVLYQYSSRTVLPTRARIIKAGTRYFILE